MKCMQTNFDGRGLSGFGVMAPFRLPSKTAKISLLTMDYSPWWAWPLQFQRFCSFVCLQKWQKFPFEPWTIVHGGQKIKK